MCFYVEQALLSKQSWEPGVDDHIRIEQAFVLMPPASYTGISDYDSPG